MLHCAPAPRTAEERLPKTVVFCFQGVETMGIPFVYS